MQNLYIVYYLHFTNVIKVLLYIYSMAHAASLPPPSIGDIKLVPYTGDSNLVGFYQVLIFYSNGVDEPGYGGICADGLYREEATVICNQMGYEHADFAYR